MDADADSCADDDSDHAAQMVWPCELRTMTVEEGGDGAPAISDACLLGTEDEAAPVFWGGGGRQTHTCLGLKFGGCEHWYILECKVGLLMAGCMYACYVVADGGGVSGVSGEWSE